ncbi:DUF2399 domain-containing protein [Streptomyces iakyrus]|uniref:DUF2399 domain-containing protein n=1 Tax=Streptomyces iakyrus TaxID=68219 RepID=UPI003D9383F7
MDDLKDVRIPEQGTHGHITLLLAGHLARGRPGPCHPRNWRAAYGNWSTWASAGLLKDDLASTVLTPNLRGTSALDWMADAGEPAVLTLRSLTGRAPVASVPTTGTVHICENPAVLSAAAGTLGPECPPMVCLQGHPSAAALTLLRVSMRGARLVYDGDFDWAAWASPQRWREASLGGRGAIRPPITEQQ